MASRFDTCWLKVNRAKYHADHLESLITAFLSSDPYEIGIKGDPVNGTGVYYIKSIHKLIPHDISLTLGDAAHNLRSALDHFAIQAVTCPTVNTSFPIYRREAMPKRGDWNSLVTSKLKGAPIALLTSVKGLQAHLGGKGEYLWILDQLDIIDKHKLVLVTIGRIAAITIDVARYMQIEHPEAVDSHDMPPVTLVLGKEGRDVLEPGTELFESDAPRGLHFEADPKFTFEVTLGQPLIVEGESVTLTLRGLINDVESLLQSLVALC